MNTPSARVWAPLMIVLSAVACATATDVEESVLPGTGGSVSATSGGSSGTGGSSLVGSGGASSSPASGGASTGGASTGGASTGGSATGGSGTTFEGACADLSAPSGVSMTGDFAVYTCKITQASCPAEALNEPAVFECISNHVPNCTGQEPSGGTNVWQYKGLCSEFGAGGAGGN